MQRKTNRFLCLVMVFAMLLAMVPVMPANAEDSITIYFQNNWLWTDVSIHYWSDTDSTIGSTWTGDKMTFVETDADGYDIYSAEVPAAITGIVFNGIKNDGSGAREQSIDIKDIQTGVYYYMVWDNAASYGTKEYTPAGSDNDCEHSYNTETVDPTCTEKGYTIYTCTLCGYSYKGAYVNATGHSFGNDSVCDVCGESRRVIYFENTSGWSQVNIYYWSDANTGMVSWPGVSMTLLEGDIWSYALPDGVEYVIFNNGSEKTGDLPLPEKDNYYADGTWSYYSNCTHNWGEGKVTTEATCTVDGVRTYTCSNCGETKTETIAAAGHNYENGACTVCGAAVECVEHTWDEGVVTTEPGCWTFGVRTYTCKVCKATKTENIYPSHDIYVAETVAATCTATGKEITKCTRCAYSYSKTLPKVDHTYVAGEKVPATCTEDGYTVLTCSYCGATSKGDIVYHIGHVWNGNVCKNCSAVCNHSYVDGICTSCHAGGPAYVEGYYEIANAAQLYWFAAQVNSGNNAINGKLVADIDLENGTWTSIGYYLSDTLEPDTVPYTGIFDGQGYCVSNFTTAGTDNEGLFGYCSSATIMNVGVANAKVTGWRAGAVAGYPLTSNVLNCYAINCTITGTTSNTIALQSGTVYIAPIASPQGGVVRNCYAVNCTLVDGTDLDVYTSPVGGTDTQNGYYYNTVYSGDFSSVRNSTEVTMEQLQSGEVTYLLNKGITDGTQGWYQTCGTGMPAHSGLTVYLITDCSARSFYSNDVNATGHTYVNGVCTGCGEISPEDLPQLVLKYPSLSFEGEVYCNIYFAVENLTDVDVTKLGLLCFAENLPNGTVADASEVLPGAILGKDGLYNVRTSGICAKNLGDTIYFKVYLQLANGKYIYSDMRSYSAVEYAKDRLANSQNANMKALCVAMLNYGAAAQQYFGYNTDTLANADLTDEQKALANAYSSDMIQPIVPVDSGKASLFANNGLGFGTRYPSVSFEGTFSINYIFAPKLSVDANMTLYYWNAEDYAAAETLTKENATGSIVMDAQGDVYKGTVSDIVAKELDKTIYVAGVYESDGTTYSTGVLPYSIGAYCLDRIAKGEANMQALAQATAVYGYYAKTYFG